MNERSSGGEVFVVDDDPAVRETLSIVLSAAGYEVVCFADGESLLSVARSRSPACILLDVHIPGRSGLDVLAELRAERVGRSARDATRRALVEVLLHGNRGELIQTLDETLLGAQPGPARALAA